MNVRFTVQYLLAQELKKISFTQVITMITVKNLKHKLNSILIKDRESSKPMSYLT